VFGERECSNEGEMGGWFDWIDLIYVVIIDIDDGVDVIFVFGSTLTLNITSSLPTTTPSIPASLS
jgi:hypothetical protein